MSGSEAGLKKFVEVVSVQVRFKHPRPRQADQAEAMGPANQIESTNQAQRVDSAAPAAVMDSLLTDESGYLLRGRQKEGEQSRKTHGFSLPRSGRRKGNCRKTYVSHK